MTNSTPSDVIETACRRIAPLFDRRDMVAVNPFMGYAEMPFQDAVLSIEETFHDVVLPQEAGLKKGPRLLCVADRAEATHGELVAQMPLRSLTRFLANFVDEEAPSPSELRSSLYVSYLRFAQVDRGLRATGLSGFESALKELPLDSGEALQMLLSKLPVHGEQLTQYLTRLLARLKGYAGFFRAQAFSAGDDLGLMPELLTILLAQDYVLAESTGHKWGPTITAGDEGYLQQRKEQIASLNAGEQELADDVVARLKHPWWNRSTRRLAQLAFCIDVRSELVRSVLERWGDIETYGFAGFFGIPMALESHGAFRPHCPPLLQPVLSLRAASPNESQRAALEKSFARALKAPVSALTHVEAWGLSYVVKLLADTFSSNDAAPGPQRLAVDVNEIPVDKRVTFASGILKNLGLQAPLAPLVVFAGHNSRVTNNPQEAGLACGACAGHGGAPSAQVAAEILNDPEVRAMLSGTSAEIPEGTLFVAAEHETVTDSVRLIRPEQLPASHVAYFEELENRLVKASAEASELRELSRPGSVEGRKTPLQRTQDYAQVQPEWALAGNALFLVGDRELSRGAELDGRSFLHSYDAQADEDGSVLEMILTAPAIVGSWINLQYYASTVAPKTFGSGRKTLHNMVGKFGVIEGTDGDLAVGLAQESLGTDAEPDAAHTPVRLHVMVQADRDRVAAIVAKHESLRNLVLGGWLRLSLLAESEGRIVLEPVTERSVLAKSHAAA